MRLAVPRNVEDRLCAELRRAGRREIGGLLFGEHLGGDDFRIAGISVQDRGGTTVQFTRDPMQHQSQLEAFFERTGREYTRYNYLGEWHSHPCFALTPSRRDITTMREILSSPDVGANFLVLIIARLRRRSLELSATGFIMQGDLAVELEREAHELGVVSLLGV